MKATIVSLLGLLTASILSGCAYEPQQRVVDFSAVDGSQPGASFELQVKVVGLNNGSVPLVGAFVGAAEGSQAIAKGTTDERGITVLRIQTGQTVRIVASAPGWTTEDSGSLRIGRANGNSDNVPMAGCSGGAAQSTDGQAAGGWCMVTAGEDDASLNLAGDRGTVSIVLFPNQVRQVFTVDIDPRLTTPFTTLPDGDRWVKFHAPLQQDAALHDLHMLRLQNATSTLSWTNDMFSQADFELGVGCRENAPEEQTEETLPNPAQRSPIMLTQEYTAGEDGRWSSCRNYYAGPVVSTGNWDVRVTIVNELTFRGRSTIIPVS